MAETTLVSSINRTDTYPKYVDNISAKYCCGAIKIVLDNSYTEQMVHELPNITINIYTEQDGERVLYTSRAITMKVPDDGEPIESILIDIPTSFTFAIIPEFDKYALLSHNKDVKINGGELWAPTTEFPITIIWDDTNVYADTSIGGGGYASDIEYDNTTSGLSATNVQDAIDEVVDDLDDKLDKAPDGTTDLIDSSGVIDPQYLPDYLLGQVIYGGNVTTNAVATLTTAAQHKLGTTSSSITLTNDTTDITGYEANEGIYYIATADFTFANINITSGDWLISTGTKWTKVDTTNEVTGVKGDAESIYRTGNVNITKTNIGLGNVDNTSDLDKPISTATQTALNSKIDTAGTGLSKTGTTLNHSNSVTANTTSSIKKFKYDSEGHITESTELTQAEQNAINSGITAEGVAQIGTNKTNISSIQNHIKFDSTSKTYYLQQAQPSNPEDGDIWIG